MSAHLRIAMLLASLCSLVPRPVSAQSTPAPGGSALSLQDAQERARQVSPTLAAAREAAAAADARARQAGAYANPTLSLQRERTSRGAQTNAQTIVSLDQPLAFGQRATRRAAAGHRSDAGEARRQDAEVALALDVTRAYASALAADRRAALAREAASSFERARRVSDERFAAGDISGYENRRIRIEAARYAVVRAEAVLAQRRARLALAALIATRDGVLDADGFVLTDPEPSTRIPLSVDSLVALAVAQRADLAAIRLDAQAAGADAALVARERWPVPVITAGIKTEEQAGLGGFNGLAAGLAVPLPIWDRRRGALDAAAADARHAESSLELARRRIEVEVRDAVAALRAVDEQLTLLRPVLGAESELALRAAEAAYVEGEIVLIEWLDAVRAHQEAEAALADLRAESIIRRAALDRAVGLPLRRSAQ